MRSPLSVESDQRPSPEKITNDGGKKAYDLALSLRLQSGLSLSLKDYSKVGLEEFDEGGLGVYDLLVEWRPRSFHRCEGMDPEGVESYRGKYLVVEKVVVGLYLVQKDCILDEDGAELLEELEESEGGNVLIAVVFGLLALDPVIPTSVLSIQNLRELERERTGERTYQLSTSGKTCARSSSGTSTSLG